MKKNEKLILKCSCGKTISITRSFKPGVIIESFGCYQCKPRRESKSRQGYLHD